MRKRKILLLGGSAQQIVAIETAKRLGYYTVLCDYLPDNPGQHHVDKFYLVSTIDKEAVLQVAKDEAVDGVLAYASDPAAPTAAYVAEQLGLPGNPYESVEILCNKDRFRAFLAENGFCTPKAQGYDSVKDAEDDLQRAGEAAVCASQFVDYALVLFARDPCVLFLPELIDCHASSLPWRERVEPW